MTSPSGKKFNLSSQEHMRLKKRRELIAALCVGLTLAVIIAYGFYAYSVKHPTVN